MRDPEATQPLPIWKDPQRLGWRLWAWLVVVLIVVPAACTMADDTKPDGPAQQDVYCDKGWCMVKQATLLNLLNGLQRMNAHITELHKLCKWDK